MKPPSSARIGFISTRFSGTDGVSLETGKWAAVLEQMGHACYYFSGQSDRPADHSRVVPEAFYRHPMIEAMNRTAYAGSWTTAAEARAARPEFGPLYKDYFSIYVRPPELSRRIGEWKDAFKEHLYAFARDFSLNLLIIENALAIPLNLPLGLAITEFIAETGFPAIAHHHDFHWERRRFMVNCVRDYIAAAFPPNLPSIRHVVINSIAAGQLASRTGLSAMEIPNVMDFDNPPAPPDEYALHARADLGLADGERLFLQPTRIIQRKGIEHAIELTRRVGIPAKLVITHAAGDEGTAYERRVRQFAKLLDVQVGFEAEIVQAARGRTADGRNVYSLADVYPQADLVTYPSSMEGFGNAFLEALYYRRPIVVNNYSIYEADIKPKGFSVIEFLGFVDDSTLDGIRHWLTHPDETAERTERNYRLARRYFSFSVLRRRLELLIADCLGESALGM
jgi:glycosyltransferase involved in cell wall biosynthesis